MLKRVKLMVIVMVIVNILISSKAVNAGVSNYCVKHIDENVIKIETQKVKEKAMVVVTKDNKTYNYLINNKLEYLPMQLGKGKYNVRIAEHVEGNNYKVMRNVNFKNTKESNYLSSSQPVYWKNQPETIKTARELVENVNNEYGKIKAIHNYLVNKIDYDDDFAEIVDGRYIPELDKRLEMEKGICYDYSALFAGMLRSQGIPVKLVKGYKNDIEYYHSWNEVYLNGEWFIIDTTYDSAYKNNKLKPKMFKDSVDYMVDKVY